MHRTRRRLSGPPPTTPSPAVAAAPTDDTWVPRFVELAAGAIGGRSHLILDTDGLVHGEHRSFPMHAADSLGAIAELEAARSDGTHLLAVTEGSRRWLQDHPELRDHVVGHYRVIADEPGAGVVIDMTSRHDDAAVTLRGEIARLAGDPDTSPAVLDWTALDIAGDLSELTVFRPPAGERLPYLDDSVEIVVADRARDRREASRVASVAVITVEADERGHPEVHTIESQHETAGATEPTVVVIADTAGDDQWRRGLAEAVTGAGAELRFESLDADGLTDAPTADVVIVVEAGLVPLPGAIAAAAANAAASPDRAVTGKVITPDARLESAGAIVFADRSVGLVGAGSADLTAPWHDFRRPTCWAPGLLAVHRSLWQNTEPPAYATGRDFMREWCAQVWADGNGVSYHPDVVTVRVQGDGGETSAPLSQSAWQRVLDLRPDRPGQLDDGAWRYVLAHDDVEHCRG